VPPGTLEKVMNKLLMSLLLLIGFGVAQAAPTPPDVAVKETTEQMRALIAQNHQVYKTDKAKFYAVVDEVLVPRFDVPGIARLVLGRNWRAATPEQRTRFTNAFKNSLIRNYADALLDNYDSVEARFQPLRLVGTEKDVTVKADLRRDNGKPIAISFAMQLVKDEWKVYDVIIENLSLVTNFRSQFNDEIKRNGLDALIARVEAGTAVQQAVDKAS
jgi:phospholipid transport system substrate-binding protein